MSMDYDNTSPHPGPAMGSGDSVTDSEIMPSVPIWEQRGKKRRGFGGGRRAATTDTSPTPSTTAAAEPRTFAEPAIRRDETIHSDMRHMDERRDRMNAPAMGTAAAVGSGAAIGADPLAESMAADAETARLHDTHTTTADDTFVAPATRTRTVGPRRSGAAPAAVALGVLAVAGLGAAGWWATSHNDNDVPELTAGSPTPVTSTAAPGAGALAANTPAPAAATPSTPEPAKATVRTASAASATRTTRTATARTRPATANSAAELGVNASGRATLPAGPQPYSSTTGSTSANTSATAPTTVNPTPAPTTPPVEAAPNTTTPEPAPTTATPDTATPPTP